MSSSDPSGLCLSRQPGDCPPPDPDPTPSPGPGNPGPGNPGPDPGTGTPTTGSTSGDSAALAALYRAIEQQRTLGINNTPGCNGFLFRYGACPSEAGAAGTTPQEVKQSLIGALWILTSAIPVSDILDVVFAPRAVASAAEEGSQAAEEIGSSQVGRAVYRIHGGESGPWGRSWTPANPLRMEDPRAELGLPKVNLGDFITKAIVRNTEGVIARDALPLDGNLGGGPEWLFPDPMGQLEPIWTVPAVPAF